MSKAERRRAARVTLHEEAATLYAGGQDIPARVLNLSTHGALVGLCDVISEKSWTIAAGDEIELSMQLGRSILSVSARAVRTGPQFIAVEFVDKGDTLAKVDEKLREHGPN